MEKRVTVIDYGLGNLRSVTKALELVGACVKVTADACDIAQAQALVLPGVGAFKRAMENLAGLGITDVIKRVIAEGKPFLGICLGLQVLFSESEEHGLTQGLGVIKGRVKKFPSTVKVPHMGWNSIQFTVDSSQLTVFKNIPNNSYFYFVHSYYAEPEDKGVIAATSEYGQEFVSAVNQGNVWGLQFHPEKSQKLGLRILENFVNSIKD